MRADPTVADELRVFHCNEDVFLNFVDDSQDVRQVVPVGDDPQFLDLTMGALAHNLSDTMTRFAQG